MVPKVVHYVYGLKPVPAGHKPDELPYYAYLAMRSALINIQPDKIYLLVRLLSNLTTATTRTSLPDRGGTPSPRT